MKTALFRFIAFMALVAPVYGEQKSHTTTFASTPAGGLPPGWQDFGMVRSSPNWAVDGRGMLRVVWKGENGFIGWNGTLQDGTITADFQKTPDEKVTFSIAGRIQDPGNYYAVRFSGANTLDLIKVTDGQEEVLADFVTMERYPEGATWTLSLKFEGPRITGEVLDGKGIVQARVDALEEDGFASGTAGLRATNFAAARNFIVHGAQPAPPSPSPRDTPTVVVQPAKDVEKLNTPFDKLASSYDVIVAGAGSGGWAAALQASRMGAKVLLLEETDWIGGQMAAAAVTSMDEAGISGKFPVRERGIYREFHESMVNYYYTLNKDPFRAYYAWPEQLEGGYEPKVVRAVLYAFIGEARRKGVLDLAVRTRVAEVRKSGDTVTGVTVEHVSGTGDTVKKQIAAKVLVEATEYGDVLPLAGARYRLGTSTSDNVDPEALIQYHTWLGVIREYPEGVPDHLRIKSPPPEYNPKRYQKSQLYGRLIWGSIGKDYKGPRVYRVLLAWRGMADTDSPMTGLPTQQRHTQCGLNGGRQDYAVDAKGIEDLAERKRQQRDGVYRTLNEIYYLQNELGLPWAVAEDEGFNTAHNRRTMESLDLRPDLLPIAIHLPQWPYVRECRRGAGVYTQRTSDMGRFKNARLFPNSVAMGDYFMDLDHGKTAHALERDLDGAEIPPGSGPFQVPFEVFIPEKINGLVFAEKNISQSRAVNGATRLQPSTILMGQAAGAIAALAARENIPPRNVNPIAVQAVLLKAGSNLVQRWYDDVPWGTPLWRATQLLTLHGVMDAPGPFNSKQGIPMGAGNLWRPDDPLESDTFSAAAKRLTELSGTAKAALPPQSMTRGEFALAAAEVLTKSGRPPLLSDKDIPADAN
ncbi:MAG: FAD-dependent oxidoreductase [Chthoniobacterales bacterium]|nr:FAD-dependent oxidoreductase [Chthoniobacterales bacterium]